jgi:hypothetical protein
MTTRLLTFKGELSLDDQLGGKDDLGTKWYEIVFRADISKAEKDFELKRVILQTPGIKEITRWNWTQTAHSVAITAIVVTDWGEVDVSQTLEAL